jgi:flagellar biosynthetic protein FliQ
MSPETIMSIARHALEVTLLLSMPLLLSALIIGLVVGIFQAATQINESTLSFIPKLVGVALALMVAGPWMLQVITGYTKELFTSIPGLMG